MELRLNQRHFATAALLLALTGCGEPTKTAESALPNTEAKQQKLTAAEAKQLASETMNYFKSRKPQFADDAVMNDDALRATFLFSKELKGISARWPGFLEGDAEADKFGHCRHLILTAQSYAEARNQFAFKGGPENLATGRRKDFMKDWKGCEAELAASL